MVYNTFSIFIEPQKETYFSVINSINLISSAYACSPLLLKTNDNIENDIYYEKFDLETYLISKPKVPTEMTLILKDFPIETSDFSLK